MIEPAGRTAVPEAAEVAVAALRGIILGRLGEGDVQRRSLFGCVEPAQ